MEIRSQGPHRPPAQLGAESQRPPAPLAQQLVQCPCRPAVPSSPAQTRGWCPWSPALQLLVTAGNRLLQEEHEADRLMAEPPPTGLLASGQPVCSGMWHSWQGTSPHTRCQSPRVILCDIRRKPEVPGVPPTACAPPTRLGVTPPPAHSTLSPSQCPGEVGGHALCPPHHRLSPCSLLRVTPLSRSCVRGTPVCLQPFDFRGVDPGSFGR